MTPAYAAVVAELAAAIPHGPLPLVLIDGVPACGKSSLARALEAHLHQNSRDAVLIENDWFMAPTIRSPVHIAKGMALALSTKPIEEVERGLLDRFLDRARLNAFQDALAHAQAALVGNQPASLVPAGAHWNLAAAPPWADRTYALRPGTVVIVEGTFSRAVYLPRFPEALCVFVEVPFPAARGRFLQRNRSPATRRNFAFSALAWVGPAYRIAAEMVGRDRDECHFRVDLSDLGAPLIAPRTRSASAAGG